METEKFWVQFIHTSNNHQQVSNESLDTQQTTYC